MAQYRNKKTIAWIALAVAVVALVLSWLAFSQADNQDIQQLIDERVSEVTADLEAEIDLLQSDPEDGTEATEDVSTTTDTVE